ncbi:MAG: hypothetical protein HQL63_07965 [Magnetococcales bacterium]|nr:hypothetical protein [Magnetococcales bacterium]
MTMSIRLDSALEARMAQEAKRLGLTESTFVTDTLERTLGLKSPADLLSAVRSNTPMGDPDASRDVSEKIKVRLREKCSP